MENKYKFTIVTPCYNSSRFIHRVFKTLTSQTYRNFEWIVINDASTDNTGDLIRDYIKDVDFKVKFYDLTVNQMLAANYNLAASVAEGEYVFIFDHDDEFIPTVLEEFVKLIEKYDGDNIAGLVARCITQHGQITTKEFPSPVMNYWDYSYIKGRYCGEMPYCFKRSIYMKYLPYDLSVSRTPQPRPIAALMGCDGYDFICSNEIVRTYYINENETALTRVESKVDTIPGKGFWCRQLLEINRFQYKRKDSFKGLIRMYLIYLEASFSIRMPFKQIVTNVVKVKDKINVILLFPLAKIFRFMLNNKATNNLIHRLFKE